MNFLSSLLTLSLLSHFGYQISFCCASSSDKNETNFHRGGLKVQINEELQKFLQKEYRIFEEFQKRYNKTYLNEKEVIISL